MSLLLMWVWLTWVFSVAITSSGTTPVCLNAYRNNSSDTPQRLSQWLSDTFPTLQATHLTTFKDLRYSTGIIHLRYCSLLSAGLTPSLCHVLEPPSYIYLGIWSILYRLSGSVGSSFPLHLKHDLGHHFGL